MGQTVLRDNDVDIDALVPLVAQNFHHTPGRIRPFSRPTRDLHHDARPRHRVQILSARNLNRHMNLFVNRRDLAAIRQKLIRPDDRLIRPSRDAQHAPFHPVPRRRPLHHLHDDRIVIRRRFPVRFGDVHILMLFIRNEETESSVRFIRPLDHRAGGIRLQIFTLHIHPLFLKNSFPRKRRFRGKEKETCQEASSLP